MTSLWPIECDLIVYIIFIIGEGPAIQPHLTAKKESTIQVFEKRKFPPQTSKTTSALTRAISNSKPIYKTYSLVHYLLYATLMTYVLFLGAEQF